MQATHPTGCEVLVVQGSAKRLCTPVLPVTTALRTGIRGWCRWSHEDCLFARFVNIRRPVRMYPGGESYFTSGCPVFHQQCDRCAAALSSTVLMGSAPSRAMSSYCRPCYASTPPPKMCVGKSTTGAPGAPARSPSRRCDSVVADVALARPTSYQSEDTTGDPCTVVTLTLLTHFPTAGKSSQA